MRVKSRSRRVFQHPDAGRVELTSEVLTAPDGQRLVTFQPVPDGPARDALTLLSLAATA